MRHLTPGRRTFSHTNTPGRTVSIASYISDEQTKNSILELLNSKKETADLIHELDTDSENKEVHKEAFLRLKES